MDIGGEVSVPGIDALRHEGRGMASNGIASSASLAIRVGELPSMVSRGSIRRG